MDDGALPAFGLGLTELNKIDVSSRDDDVTLSPAEKRRTSWPASATTPEYS